MYILPLKDYNRNFENNKQVRLINLTKSELELISKGLI